MLRYLLFLTVLVSGMAEAQIYGVLQGNYSQLKQQKQASNNVYPTGAGYGAGIGFRKNFYEFEAMINKLNLAGDIDHDGESNTIKHDQTSLMLAFNFYFNKVFYARLGYGFHKIDQTLEKDISEASMDGAKKAYDLQENKVTDGILYGAGFVIFDGRKVSLFTQFENMNMSSINGNAWNLSLGLKIYLD